MAVCVCYVGRLLVYKMADSERTGEHVGTKGVETAKYNPKLDFFSEEFDPLLALNTPNVIIPDSSAKTYDNIHKYKSTYEPKSNENKPKIDKKAAEKVIERKWLPHQRKLSLFCSVLPMRVRTLEKSWVRCDATISENAVAVSSNLSRIIRIFFLRNTIY